jgi:hypothetical protein
MEKKEKKISLRLRLRESSACFSEYGNHICLVLLFILTFVYFQWFGRGVFFHQENNSLFIFSGDYFGKYAGKPGGLLVYAGNFLTQGYFSTTYGSLVNASLLVFLFLILLSVQKQFFKNTTSGLFMRLLVPMALLVCQASYNYYIFHTLGFLTAALGFRLSIAARGKAARIFVLLLFPLFYYAAGTFAIVYLVMYLIHCSVYEDGKEKYLFTLIHLGVCIFTLIVFYRVLFLQHFRVLLNYPLIVNDFSRFTIPMLVAVSLFVTFSLLIRLSDILRLEKFDYFKVAGAILLLFPGTIFFLISQNNPVLEGIMQTEKLFIERKTDKIISHFEKFPSDNIVEQFYYNLALSEKDQLCNRMFFGRQSSGPMSLSLEGNREQSSRTVYYYYTIGLVNEAHHLAFEQMVRTGYTPENIKMLIKTELLNSNFKVAERYLNVLQKTLRYRTWADKYERFLFNPDLLKTDVELGEKIWLMPQEDFFILSNETNNIEQLIKSNPLNRKAFEYKMARLLLEKDLMAVEEEVKNMKAGGYNSLPRHIDEAIVAYMAFSKSQPELGGLSSDPETGKRFAGYAQTVNGLKGNKSLIETKMKKAEKNTFWYYLQFGTITGEFMKSNPVDRDIY